LAIAGRIFCDSGDSGWDFLVMLVISDQISLDVHDFGCDFDDYDYSGLQFAEFGDSDEVFL